MPPVTGEFPLLFFSDIRARYNADQQNQKGSSPTNSYDNVLSGGVGGELGLLADLDEVPGMDRDVQDHSKCVLRS